MNHCPGDGVVGCQDPRAELPTEVAVEAGAQEARKELARCSMRLSAAPSASGQRIANRP